tara:strand:- start:2204 stop:2899 length:696 start_codon:yes stop_codon:yes gene_type:complete
MIIFSGFLATTSQADNEIYVNQVGATSNIDLEQLGSNNLIGGLNAVIGTMTALDLDGTSLTLDINQIGNNNIYRGDILGNSNTVFMEFDGDSNSFTIQVDPTNTYSADSGNYYVDVTGSSNSMTLNVGTAALSDTLDLDWIINGSSNSITSNIDIDQATNYMDIDGSSNTINYDGDGYATGYFYLDQTGSSKTFNIQQQSTAAQDWLKIISNSSNGTMCVIQSDQGTSTSC